MADFICEKCKKSFPSRKCSTFCEGKIDGLCTHCLPKIPSFSRRTDYRAGPQCPPWLRSIGLVEFDLQLGIVVRYLNPPLPLSVKQETEIAFLCFPDANLVEDGDSTHDFVFAYNPSECDSRRTTVLRSQMETDQPPGSPVTPAGAYGKGYEEVFCTAVFRQRRDPTVTRGARQNAIVILGNYPFPAVHRLLLEQLLVYFDTPSCDPVAFLITVAESLGSWPKPLPDTTYHDLPFLGTTLSFTTPHYSTSHIWSIPQPNFELSVHQRSDGQRLVEALSASISSSTVVSPTSSCATALMEFARGDSTCREAIQTMLGVSDLEKDLVPEIGLSTQLQLIQYLLNLSLPESDGVTANSTEPEEISEELLKLMKESTLPPREVMEVENRTLASLLNAFQRCEKPTTSKSSSTARPAHPGESQEVFEEVELNAAFFPHITKLWKLWELMIVGGTIGIIGPNAPLVSAIALGMASLVSPLHFTGLLRPYLTINNREIDHCVKQNPQPATIVAATNPFFVRHQMKWPHFLCVGDPDGDVQTHKTLPAESEKRQKQQYKLKNRMFCSRHYLVKTDKAQNDLFLKAPPGKGSYIRTSARSPSPSPSRSSPVFGTEIRKALRELTVEFLDPLTKYVDSTIARERPYFVLDADFRSLFSHKVMLDVVQSTGAVSRFKTAAEAREVYENFLTTPTFQKWLQDRVELHFRQFIMEAASLPVVLATQETPKRRYEVLSLLQWHLRRHLNEPLHDVPFLKKLAELCAPIVALRNTLSKSVQ